LIFRDGEAKLLEVPRDIGEALLIRHAERPMNIGALMQEVHDVEERGLDRHAIRLHRFSRNRAYGGSELAIYSMVQLAKKYRSIRIR
jgi:hypothetical protein